MQSRKISEPYKYYSSRPEYRDAIFVKLDDDVVFIETARFQTFVSCVDFHKERIWSTNVINNVFVRSLPLTLRQKFEKAGLIKNNSLQSWWFLCVSVDFFKMSHQYFFSHALD
jgi:hypothetical protein